MSLSPLRPCPTPGCPTLVRKGHCAAHARQREQQRPNRDVRKWYYTARWKALRAQVLSENPLCVDCEKKGRVTVASDVHHREKHDGNDLKFWDINNLEGLCHSHHSRHTGKGE